MKNLIFFVCLLGFIFFGCEKELKNNDFSEIGECAFVNFKYYQGEKDMLGEMSANYLIIGSDTAQSDAAIKALLTTKNYLDHNFKVDIQQFPRYKYKTFCVKLSHTRTCSEIAGIINDLKRSAVINYAHYAFQTNNCNNLVWEPIGEKCVDSYSAYFYVKLKDADDMAILNNVVSDTNTTIENKVQYMDNWYVLSADKNSKGDALKMANYFHETGFFESADPDITQHVVVPLD